MVKKNAQGLFACEECGLAYVQWHWAKKCEDWCRLYHTCSLAITRHAVK